jgi:hypothetical protein
MDKTKKGARILPEGFRPCEDCVIVGGRGRKVTQHVGNRRFVELVADELTDYAHACNKTEKSYVLAKVLYTVRRWKGDGEKIGFVKWDAALGRWIAPTDGVARVAVAQVRQDKTRQDKTRCIVRLDYLALLTIAYCLLLLLACLPSSLLNDRHSEMRSRCAIPAAEKASRENV